MLPKRLTQYRALQKPSSARGALQLLLFVFQTSRQQSFQQLTGHLKLFGIGRSK